jgi:formylglycine-generating enzyme required for sulfatase activity
MTRTLTLKQRQERAARRVGLFVAQFEPSYYDLVCHTALPLVLTPELVSYLRNEFLRELPWIAEVDLLLSDLCKPVGYELYVMDSDIRAYVLEQRSPTFDTTRMREVANLLISYVRYLADHRAQLSDKELETQQWAAMLYLGEAERQTVVSEIVERFQAVGSGGTQVGADLLSRAEMARLAQITQTLKPQLADYPGLIEYASLVSDVQMRNVILEKERVERTYVVAPGQFLRLPAVLQTELVAKNRIKGSVGPRQTVVGPRQTVEEREPPQVLSQPSEGTESGASYPEFEPFDFIDARFADDGDTTTEQPFPPPLQPINFTIITVEPEQSLETAQNLEPFEFTVATLQRRTAQRQRSRKQQEQTAEWEIHRQQQRAYRFIEPLPEDIALEMVAIPAGTFLMGSPEDEPDRYDYESPQHEVTVESFFMGRYPITQAQWRAVANLPQVERELDPDPANFKGDNRPVEKVSWLDATEYCARLSAYTGREYRLPSEAEWEYACRAGTTTPFHFNETISSEVACYQGGTTYAGGPEGENREETTPVDHFEVANTFGLSDMHGNVLEWCQDHWHSNYEGAPTDGSAWLTEDDQANRVFRGGSWCDGPRSCRSAYRTFYAPDDVSYFLGFRVVCSAPRTL